MSHLSFLPSSSHFYPFLSYSERNHNIRIPGFASDETRFSQSGVAGGAGASGGAATSKKGTQGTHMTLRSSRLAAVQQAKKDAKLI